MRRAGIAARNFCAHRPTGHAQLLRGSLQTSPCGIGVAGRYDGEEDNLRSRRGQRGRVRQGRPSLGRAVKRDQNANCRRGAGVACLLAHLASRYPRYL